MTAARHRHPNRTGLRAEGSPAGPDHGQVLTCRCPAKLVAGTAWAYDARLGWHHPAEHATWTPPSRPATVPLPPALLLDDGGARRSPRTPTPRCHVLLPAGRGQLVCDLCGLVFDAAAFTDPDRPLPACSPRPQPEPSAAGPSVHPATAHPATAERIPG